MFVIMPMIQHSIFFKQFIFIKTKKPKNIELCPTRCILDLNMKNVKVKGVLSGLKQSLATESPLK